MKLTVQEAWVIAQELKSSHIQATVGQGVDIVHFYVYSTDPLIPSCGCGRKDFDVKAAKAVQERVKQFSNVAISSSGPAQPLSL